MSSRLRESRSVSFSVAIFGGAVLLLSACGADTSSSGGASGGGTGINTGGGSGGGSDSNDTGTGGAVSTGGARAGGGSGTGGGAGDPGVGGNSGGSAGMGDDGACEPSAPESFADDYVADHNVRMNLVDCNRHVALYFDDDMLALGSARTEWVMPFVTEVWRFIKDNYGSCAVPRDLPAPIGPGCERFGEEQLYAFFHHNKHFGGTIALRFDGFSGYRNTIDVGDNGWNESNRVLHDEIVHEACHQVEGGGQGVHESPAFGVIWGDSKWVEFCMYDFYQRSGKTMYASEVHTQFMDQRDNLPQGSVGSAWFRDWFYPLWQENGGDAAVMDRFFGLLSQHFPKRLENDDRNYVYTRRMNPGEYVHFTSGAAGRDLSARAQQVFSGFNRTQFDQAKSDFPAVSY